MRKTSLYQEILFPELAATFPSTRYQGSKAKLVDRLWEKMADLDFSTCLDAFGGTGAVAYRLKRAGKQVTYNDLLRFNYYIGLALVENREVRLTSEETEWLLERHPEISYPSLVSDTFHDIYFTDDENAWFDQTITNIRHLSDRYKFALAFFALAQACIIKRPYNLFHRKNLYLRFAEVKRSFGNKTTWDRPFPELFDFFVAEANEAVFDNGRANRAISCDALDLTDKYDLVYIDTPYISKRAVPVDYFGFYHFLEGLTIYDEWLGHIDWNSKHRRMRTRRNPWTDKALIYSAFENLFQKYQDSILVVSYRSDGIPTEPELVDLLKRYKDDVCVEHLGKYKYVLSTNSESKEIVLIAT